MRSKTTDKAVLICFCDKHGSVIFEVEFRSLNYGNLGSHLSSRHSRKMSMCIFNIFFLNLLLEETSTFIFKSFIRGDLFSLCEYVFSKSLIEIDINFASGEYIKEFGEPEITRKTMHECGLCHQTMLFTRCSCIILVL